jgi:hypothetical protein
LADRATATRRMPPSSGFGHEVEAVVQGELDAFGETFSFEGPDQSEMVG